MKNPAVVQFLFLEIHDPDFNAFYDDLVLTITGARPRKRPHLTVRGPYRGRIGGQELTKFREVMRYAVLKISGVGTFSNPREQVVYFGVDSPQLRSIWWKPDFPIGSHGYNPHISIYRGNDVSIVETLISFTPLKRVEFLCAEHQLVPVIKDRRLPSGLVFHEFKRARDHSRLEAKTGLGPDFFRQLRAALGSRFDHSPEQLSLFEAN